MTLIGFYPPPARSENQIVAQYYTLYCRQFKLRARDAKSAGKHQGDKKNLPCDKIQKTVFEICFTGNKTRFTGNNIRFMRHETRFGRGIMTTPYETKSASQEKASVSQEMKPATREIKKISFMFFSAIHPEINYSNI
jgi:hypothetical protein